MGQSTNLDRRMLYRVKGDVGKVRIDDPVAFYYMITGTSGKISSWMKTEK